MSSDNALVILEFLSIPNFFWNADILAIRLHGTLKAGAREVADVPVKADKIGTIELTVRFKMGMDDSHKQYLKTNDDHETYESWQCSVAEGYRARIVKRETPDTVKELVKDGKVDGDNVEMNVDSDDDNPETEAKNDVVRIPRSAPGFEKEVDSYHASSDPSLEQAKWGGLEHELEQYTSDASASSASIVSDDPDILRVQEDFTDSELDDDELKKRRQKQDTMSSKNELHRKHRGTMNIKALRHLKFGKDEAKVLGHKIKGRFSMKGREPGGKFLFILCVFCNVLIWLLVDTEL